MSTYYAIAKIDFEYNDEIYHTSENEGYHVTEIYSSKEKAVDICLEKNIEKWKEEDLYNYGYSEREILNIDRLSDIFEDNDIEFDCNEFDIESDGKLLMGKIKLLPKSEQIRAINCFKVMHYKVIPVELIED